MRYACLEEFMDRRCTYSQELGNHSAIPEHASTRCGKPATFSYGSQENKSELYLCDEHAEIARKADRWGAESVVPLSKGA